MLMRLLQTALVWMVRGFVMFAGSFLSPVWFALSLVFKPYHVDARAMFLNSNALGAYTETLTQIKQQYGVLHIQTILLPSLLGCLLLEVGYVFLLYKIAALVTRLVLPKLIQTTVQQQAV